MKKIFSMAIMFSVFFFNANASTTNSVNEVVGMEMKINPKKIQITEFETKQLTEIKRSVEKSANNGIKKSFADLISKYEQSGLLGKVFYMNKIIDLYSAMHKI